MKLDSTHHWLIAINRLHRSLQPWLGFHFDANLLLLSFFCRHSLAHVHIETGIDWSERSSRDREFEEASKSVVSNSVGKREREREQERHISLEERGGSFGRSPDDRIPPP